MYITITLIIILHEFGHILSALYFRWNIIKIIILPFGGLTIFEENINRPLKQEFIVAISGPILQILFYCILKNYFQVDFYYYNLYILLFNLLPIYPLDGYKIVNTILNKFIPFYITNMLTILFSLIIVIILLSIYTIKFNLIYLIILLFLLKGIIEQRRNIPYIYNKFLLERYNYHIKYNKYKKINNENHFFKDYTHLIKIKNHYISEYDFLKSKFKTKI